MTDQLATSMRTRIAGQAVIEKTLAAQAKGRKRSLSARFLGLDPLDENTRQWFTDSRGEIEVGRILDMLPDDWAAFHSMPIGNRDTDVDHIIVGPAGLFTVTTKAHRGREVRVADRMIRIDGHKQVGYIPGAEREAIRVTELVKRRMADLPPVRPILALATPSRIRVRIEAAPQQVAVLVASDLPGWLTKQDPVLTPEQCAQVTKMLDDPSLWPPRTPSTEADAASRFHALDHEVRTAHRTRLGVRLAGAVVVVGAGVAFVPTLVMALFP